VISSRTRHPRHARRRTDHRRRLRLAALGAVLAFTLVLGVHTLDGGSSAAPTPALAHTPPTALAPDGPPRIESLAGAPGGLVLDMPITQGRITAIVYHGVGDDGAIALTPDGHQRNADLLTRLGNMLVGTSGSSGPGYYVDSSAPGDPTSSVDVGALAGTGVYSPVDGRVVSLRPYVINGRAWGSVIQIQPSSTPALMVTLTNVNREPSIAVGANVSAGQTKLGTVADLSKVLQQDVARFTSDAGNHVHIEVSQEPAAAPTL
jgi:hypothetical protein